jgi:hypothetical protein
VRELSVFVDESGDFGAYGFHSPYYIVTLVFHDQDRDISSNITHLNDKIRISGFPDTPIHTAPLIRRENEYGNLTLHERKRIFNALYNFARTTDILAFVIEKRLLTDNIDLHIQITKQLSAFMRDKMESLLKFDRIVLYYDNGQMELTKILVSVFNAILSNAEFKKVVPTDYKLFQAADMLCTLELLSIKAKRKMLSNSERLFFTSERNLYKSYLKGIYKKRFT